MKKLFYTLVLTTLILTPQAHAAASSSEDNQSQFVIPSAWAKYTQYLDSTGPLPGGLWHGILRDLVRRAFFEQLAIVRADNPFFNHPRELISAALEKVAADPERNNPKDIVFIDNFGLSIEDLIQHNLLPQIDIHEYSGNILSLYHMYIDNLTGIQKIPNVQSVNMLYLNNNRLLTLELNAFAGLDNLNHLDLSHNQLPIIESNAFGSLPQLWALHLNDNRLQTIESNAFTGLHQLQYLHLDHNQLQTIEPNTFAGLQQLQFLYLNNNQLKTITTNSFAGLNALTTLELDSNELQTIEPKALLVLNHLLWLGLDENHIINLEEQDRIIEEVSRTADASLANQTPPEPTLDDPTLGGVE